MTSFTLESLGGWNSIIKMGEHCALLVSISNRKHYLDRWWKQPGIWEGWKCLQNVRLEVALKHEVNHILIEELKSLFAFM